MKFLKHYKLFLEAEDPIVNTSAVDPDLPLQNDKVNSESLQQIQKNLSEYKQKRQVLDDIFKSNLTDDVKLNNDIQNKVYGNEKDVKKRNTYLQSYEALLKLKRMVDKISSSIETDTSRKFDITKQLNDLSDRLSSASTDVDKTSITSQINKSKEYIETLNQTILSNKKELVLADKNYQKKKKDLDSQMKIEEDKIKKLLSK